MRKPNIHHTLKDFGYYLSNNPSNIFCPILPGTSYYIIILIFKVIIAYPIYLITKLLK